MNRLLTTSLIFLVVLFNYSTVFGETITLPSDQEISVEVYGEPSAKYTLLWMHSERGIRGELQKTILSISKQQDIQVLLPDWLDAYFINPTRSSLEKIPQQDYEDLITQYAKLVANKPTPQVNKLFIMATGRSASLVLNAAHHLQTQGIKNIGGVILMSPYLQEKTPKIGTKLEYQKIVSLSNLPIYAFQPERSPRFVPFPHLVEELQKGGSSVYAHVFKDIAGGFHMRPKEDLSGKDFEAREGLHNNIVNALSLLDQTETSALKTADTYVKNVRKRMPLKLQQISMEKTPSLRLKDLTGKLHDIKDYKGKTVLVSYWASWCRPCIEEMPSLVRLKDKYKDHLEILAVNVREDKATIEKFTKTMNINFPLLQDHDSSTVEDWRVYVYPSNYIVDKNGAIRYAATGAMDWQDEDIERVIEELQ